MLRRPGLERIGRKHMKTCFKCGEKKQLSEFYRYPMMADGRLNKCKECTKKDVSKNYRDNLFHYKQYDKSRSMLPHRVKAREQYVKTEIGKLSRAKAHKKQKEIYPVKYAARTAVANAIKNGRLTKHPCKICGTLLRVEAHHKDYSKPLLVKWLCKKHHNEVHHSKN